MPWMILFLEYLQECLDYQTAPDLEDFALWAAHR